MSPNRRGPYSFIPGCNIILEDLGVDVVELLLLATAVELALLDEVFAVVAELVVLALPAVVLDILK